MTLAHQAFLYDSPDDFVAGMGPYVREGLERGERIFGATKPENVAALREALGRDGELVELHDTTEWMTRPYERLQAFKRLVAELPLGGVLRALGEPIWTGSDAVVRQWARYESVINLALADAPMRFVCLYDSSRLPDDILEYALRTHPERVEGGSTVACEAFVPPDRFATGHPPAPPESVSELPLEGSALRRVVGRQAERAGLPRRRVEEFVLAASEVAANALRHGRPPVRAQVWAEPESEIVCQVSDAGPGIGDPLTGWAPPEDPAQGGWGLPLARQLCDAVDIARSEAGTLVSLHMSIGGLAPAR